MSLFKAIADMKGAFIGGLLRNLFPQDRTEPAMPQLPVVGKPHPCPSGPQWGHMQPAKPSFGRPHPYQLPVTQPAMPARPLFTINR